MKQTTGEQLRDMQKAFAEPLMKRIAELEAELAALKAQEPVAYLDIGSEGYIDLSSYLDDDELLKLPEGRHPLYLHPAQPQSDGVIVPRELLDRFPEINMGNFGADEVKLLNDWGIEVSLLGGE